jgi:hypothetical protein
VAAAAGLFWAWRYYEVRIRYDRSRPRRLRITHEAESGAGD